MRYKHDGLPTGRGFRSSLADPRLGQQGGNTGPPAIGSGLLTVCSQNSAATAATTRDVVDGWSENVLVRVYAPALGATRQYEYPRLKPLWPQGRAGSNPAPGTGI
jgi:hypothetical protein